MNDSEGTQSSGKHEINKKGADDGVKITEDEFNDLFKAIKEDSDKRNVDILESTEEQLIGIIGEEKATIGQKQPAFLIDGFSIWVALSSDRAIKYYMIAVGVLACIGLYATLASNINNNIITSTYSVLPEKDNIIIAAQKQVDMYLCKTFWNNRADIAFNGGLDDFEALAIMDRIIKSEKQAGWDGTRYKISPRDYSDLNVCGSYFIPSNKDNIYDQNVMQSVFITLEVEPKLSELIKDGGDLSAANPSKILELKQRLEELKAKVADAAVIECKDEDIDVRKTEVLVWLPVTRDDQPEVKLWPFGTSTLAKYSEAIIKPVIEDMKQLLADQRTGQASDSGNSLAPPPKPEPPARDPDAEVIRPIPKIAAKPAPLPPPPPSPARGPNPADRVAALVEGTTDSKTPSFDSSDVSNLLNAPSADVKVKCMLERGGVVVFNQTCTFNKSGNGNINFKKDDVFSIVISGTGPMRFLNWENEMAPDNTFSETGLVSPDPTDKACWVNQSVRICARR